jgi:hypothetical protein
MFTYMLNTYIMKIEKLCFYTLMYQLVPISDPLRYYGADLLPERKFDRRENELYCKINKFLASKILVVGFDCLLCLSFLCKLVNLYMYI